MSADLLRRAAAKLRERAEHPDLTPGPWVCLDGGDRIINFGADGGHEYVVDEPVSNAANAELIALMDPPVALALAEWLESYVRSDAPFFERDRAFVGIEQAVAVARAVLREDGGTA